MPTSRRRALAALPLVLPLALALTTAGAAAQGAAGGNAGTNAGGNNRGTAQGGAQGPAAAPGASSLSSTDQEYFKKNAQGSVYDLTLAQLGVLRGSTPRVRDYAGMVVTDHARLNVSMLALANRERMYDLPLTLASDDNTRLQRLMGLTGPAFDQAFAAEEVRINAEDVSDSQKELGATKSAAVRRVVQTFHQTESKHLAGARALASK